MLIIEMLANIAISLSDNIWRSLTTNTYSNETRNWEDIS